MKTFFVNISLLKKVMVVLLKTQNKLFITKFLSQQDSQSYFMLNLNIILEFSSSMLKIYF